MMQQTRRNFIIGLGTLLSTPAIVKAENLMKLYVPNKKLLSSEIEFSLEPPPPYINATQLISYLKATNGVLEWHQMVFKIEYRHGI